jgi:hypothetical protein
MEERMGKVEIKLDAIQDVILEKNIVVFSPHYDDVLFGLGGYILELKARDLLSSKNFHLIVLFSRSNYQVGSGAGNYDTSLERIKMATGNRVIEDMGCLDELLGEHRYRYELGGERECLLRSKKLGPSGLEFPHGMYADFIEEDWLIFARIQNMIENWAQQDDTALIFPLAIKEHIDHFITREAAITTTRKMGSLARARFYFQEDKPYAGLQSLEEETRIRQFVDQNDLAGRIYRTHPEQIIDLGFKHYISQVEEVYREGIRARSQQLMAQYQLKEDCDQIFKLLPSI